MAEGHNTSLPPSRAQALSSSPSKTKTKAEEALFVLKMVEENVAPRRRSARQQVPKVHVQTGRFRPVSDRYPHLYSPLRFSPVKLCALYAEKGSTESTNIDKARVHHPLK